MRQLYYFIVTIGNVMMILNKWCRSAGCDGKLYGEHISIRKLQR